MRRIVGVLVVAVLSVLSIGAQQPPQTGREPAWAFPAIAGSLPAEEGPKRVPGSTKTYTPAQIDDLLNPPDWFPDEHPPAPAIVQKGRGAALACGACHLMSGEGHPESAGLTGFTAAYVMQQMADFKSGARKDAARMNAIAREVSDEESRQVAEWFAALKPGMWTKVTEAATAPKTFVGQGRMRFLQPGGGTEPIGNRIITVPQDQTRASNRDPHSGFMAYVPVGSLAKGKALIETGGSGKTIACSICHGDSYRGLGNVPRLAGLHPIYIVRQLYNFQTGANSSTAGAQMKKVAEKLTEGDMIAIAAYAASLAP